ncbi:uncharacterized protein STEHIDRAFT_173034 [Stereum hirsutum FP-91666 SS1]|uniref:Uncharacterized protein n=1 Tax=Stereum hirsutum (strain FP-91666) TaxID=721885 RepID=R7RWF9_STEHR|nr:uncharacterized protein STEHIDRAFT_173034 [Stereum hirsutum FP-91666 SS1]EIM79701.1 hypothetical protein STEHIDRAFT_173034 [Stereum hirsutum FP-91666 SS1]
MPHPSLASSTSSPRIVTCPANIHPPYPNKVLHQFLAHRLLSSPPVHNQLLIIYESPLKLSNPRRQRLDAPTSIIPNYAGAKLTTGAEFELKVCGMVPNTRGGDLELLGPKILGSCSSMRRVVGFGGDGSAGG